MYAVQSSHPPEAPRINRSASAEVGGAGRGKSTGKSVLTLVEAVRGEQQELHLYSRLSSLGALLCKSPHKRNQV